MKRKEEILDTLKSELSNLEKQYDIKKIGIFGSYVRNEQTEKSDLDIIIELGTPFGFFKFIELEDHLSQKLGVKVDLVTIDALKPLIKPRILEEAIYA